MVKVVVIAEELAVVIFPRRGSSSQRMKATSARFVLYW